MKGLPLVQPKNAKDLYIFHENSTKSIGAENWFLSGGKSTSHAAFPKMS